MFGRSKKKKANALRKKGLRFLTVFLTLFALQTQVAKGSEADSQLKAISAEIESGDVDPGDIQKKIDYIRIYFDQMRAQRELIKNYEKIIRESEKYEDIIERNEARIRFNNNIAYSQIEQKEQLSQIFDNFGLLVEALDAFYGSIRVIIYRGYDVRDNLGGEEIFDYGRSLYHANHYLSLASNILGFYPKEELDYLIIQINHYFEIYTLFEESEAYNQIDSNLKSRLNSDNDKLKEIRSKLIELQKQELSYDQVKTIYLPKVLETTERYNF